MIVVGPACAQVYAQVCAAIHGTAFPPGEAWAAPAFASLLASPGIHGLIAPDPQAGLVLIRRAADEAEILTLATVPQARRQGVARRLLAGALDWAGSSGVARVFLEVSADNAPALALYAATGFAEIARRPRYYPGGGDALVLRLSLGG